TKEFQSAPDIAAGGISESVWIMQRTVLVSIRPRHCCRGNLPRELLINLSDLFQSAPGIAAGGIAGVPTPCGKCPKAVSIRPRHCRRWNPRDNPCTSSTGLFQSAPGIAAGGISITSNACLIGSQFQSAPGIAAGGIVPERCLFPGFDCFNPPPALLPGESRA